MMLIVYLSACILKFDLICLFDTQLFKKYIFQFVLNIQCSMVSC